MQTTINPTILKERVKLSGLLERLGFRPVRCDGPELSYPSMISKGDHKLSFSLNDDLGVWYDARARKGGNIVDFGLAYWPNLNFREVLEKIWETAQQAAPVDLKQGVRRPRKARRLPHYEVEAVKPLGTTAAISDYLVYRGVDSVAQGLLEEVHYFVRNEQRQVRHFCAAGHRNECGGWVARNKYFKGCLSHSGLTVLPGEVRKVSLFEDYFDFLSWKVEHPQAGDSVIVLNSVSLLGAAVKVALRYPEIDCYFDHDKPGREATREFLKALPYARNRSDTFKGYHDYNAKRKAEAKAKRLADHPPVKGFFDQVSVTFGR